MTEQSGPRIFSIEEANSLVPELSRRVGRQMELSEKIQKLVSELHGHLPIEQEGAAEVVDITVHPNDDGEVRTLKREVAKLLRRYRQGWRDVEALGAVIKDTRSGLVDFYGRVDNRVVWLCWRFGESAIDFYHELDQGFDGRKPLADVRKRMLN
jgi:hypothetical protein